MDEDIKRRSACDRCRRQKLRCVRSDHFRGNETTNIPDQQFESSCVRCKKATVPCRTTRAPAKAGGRRFRQDDLSRNERILDVGLSVESSDALKGSNGVICGAFAQDSWGEFDITPPALTELDLEQRHDTSKDLDGIHDTPDVLDMEMVHADNGTRQRQISFTNPPGKSLHKDPDPVDATLHMLAQEIEPWPFRDILPPSPGSYFAVLPNSQISPGDSSQRTSGTFSRLPTSSNGLTTPGSQDWYTPANQTNWLSDETIEPDSSETYTVQLLDLNRRLMKQTDAGSSLRRLRVGFDSPILESLDRYREVYSSSLREYSDRVLNDSQSLLRILQRLQSSLRISSKQRRASKRPQARSEDSSAPSSEYHAVGNSDDDYSSASSGEVLHIGVSSPASLDFQTLLTVVSCYTYVLQDFDSLFTEILHMLETSVDRCSGSALPYFLPEVSIGNFCLAGQSELQTKCFLHISAMILEEIENTLGIGSSPANARASGGGGLLSNSHSGSLLDALYSRKEIIHEKADGTRTARAKHTLTHIYRLLNST